MRNSSSLEQLVSEQLPAAMRFAIRLTGDADQAEEVVQEALARAVRKWPAFRGEASFRTWLLAIVINVFRDRLRRAREDALPIDECHAPLVDRAAAGPPAAAMAAELEALVAGEVSRLPPRQREVLVLSAYEGLSASQVAQVVGISEANVHSTLSLARARLKARLAPYLNSVND